ncbi:MAG: four helix bundle protein [Raineya sp.]|jgi:four helix bundle protein|nr:four helix bundle protein [Raineya sp.]
MSVIRDKSFALAIRIVKLYQYLKTEKTEFVMSKQILRSGTSIGANIREAEQAESKKDFIHKLSIAQKEANETIYWLELLRATEFIDDKSFESIHQDTNEVMKIISKSIITSKKNLAKGQ